MHFLLSIGLFLLGLIAVGAAAVGAVLLRLELESTACEWRMRVVGVGLLLVAGGLIGMVGIPTFASLAEVPPWFGFAGVIVGALIIGFIFTLAYICADLTEDYE